MKSSSIRKSFLNYFADQGHKIFPSSSLIPADPTMLLTGAGMVQFKPIFLGKEKVDFSRAASAQKCVRTTDIDQVGKTSRHLTFFEMLGNFSFGDYYKLEACSWAWEYLTKILSLPIDKLWITVFETDDEAYQIWHKQIGIAAERIVRLGEKDNFWAAGPTGPCGPCSEILFDQGQERSCQRPNCGIGCDCDRYLEIWNLVFMQYNRDEKGELHPLPRRNIDTGMGLERIASVLQGAKTNFEIDTIKPIIDLVSSLAGVPYNHDAKANISLKIVADHARAIAFMVADGIAPSNEGRGYILRRLIRRAIRHGRLINIQDAFLSKITDKVVEIMGGSSYPELNNNHELIKLTVDNEEERFSQTLRQGLNILGQAINQLNVRKTPIIPGEIAFKLYDTYGFPLELTEEIAAEQGLKIDYNSFNQLMEEQKKRARAGSVSKDGHAKIFVEDIYRQILEEFGKNQFVGYQKDSQEAKVAAIVVEGQLVDKATEGQEVEVFLDKTPFYSEKGGQVGDSGAIFNDSGQVQISTTQSPIADLISHHGKVTKGEIFVGQTVQAEVDRERRVSIARNHTATHLLHWALRIILGQHVKQAGSLVESERLRFDFTHHQPLSVKDISAVEQMINEKILQNHPVRAYVTSIDYAKEIGAIALFGEKYGRFVRVVEIGNFSKELCGGIHLGATSEVGFFKIVSQSSIGANARRIEAVTGKGFLKEFHKLEKLLNDVSSSLEVKMEQLPEAVAKLKAELQASQSQLQKLRAFQINEEIKKIISKSEKLNDTSIFTYQFSDLDMESLRQLADKLRAQTNKSVVILASKSNGRVSLLIAATQAVVKQGFAADKLIKQLAGIIGGGGGGRADLAQAGGKLPEKLPELFAISKKILKEMIK
jgi:alanyl-tRNA synthetase